MEKKVWALIGAWFQGGFVTDAVDDFFRLFGRELTTRSLAGVVELTQKWMKGLRPDGVERWEMPKLDVRDTERLASSANSLGMLEAVTPETDDCDGLGLVILGAMLESMEHRLLFAIHQGLGHGKIFMATGVRPLIDREKKILSAAGCEANGKTEADAARFVLDQHGITGEVIAAANKSDGKRATTEETILELAKSLPAGGSLTLVSHMPFRFRQELTVRRALAAAGSQQRVTVLGAPPLKSIEELVPVLFDEACRVLYELGQLPNEMLAEQRPAHRCCNCNGGMLDVCARMQTCICQETCDGRGNLLST